MLPPTRRRSSSCPRAPTYHRCRPTNQLSALFSGRDLDGDTLSYYVYNSNTAANSGHVVVGGNMVPAQTITAMTAAQLAQATFVAGAAGTYDDILVQAFDGKAYSGWNSSVHVGVYQRTTRR